MSTLWHPWAICNHFLCGPNAWACGILTVKALHWCVCAAKTLESSHVDKKIQNGPWKAAAEWRAYNRHNRAHDKQKNSKFKRFHMWMQVDKRNHRQVSIDTNCTCGKLQLYGSHMWMKTDFYWSGSVEGCRQLFTAAVLCFLLKWVTLRSTKYIVIRSF